MIKNVASHVSGVEIYGIVSICLFFAVFAGALAWACLLTKTAVRTISSLPLDRSEMGALNQGDRSHE